MNPALIFYQLIFGYLGMALSGGVPLLPSFSRRVKEGFHDFLGSLQPLPPGPSVWVHGVSMGESMVASAIMDALKKRFPDLSIGFTSTHPDVLDLVRRKNLANASGFFPLDFFLSARRALDRWNPRLVILSETDFWPCFSFLCKSRGIPLILVNGRISDKIHRFYSIFRSFGDPIFRNFQLLCVQGEKDREKLLELGCNPSSIKVLGNIKFDLVQNAGPVDLIEIKKWKGDSKLLVFGSVHPLEFAMLEPVFRFFSADPSVRMILAPRDIKNSGVWETKLRGLGLNVALRSCLNRNGTTAKILILDSFGELATIYSLSDGVFIGGTLDPAVGGHNPIEALNHGVPVVVGPHYRNFTDLVDKLERHQGIRIAHFPGEIEKILSGFIIDDEKVQAQNENAFRIVSSNRGCLDRTINEIRVILSKANSSPVNRNPKGRFTVSIQ